MDSIVGYAPTVKIGKTEQQKYEEMWQFREYADKSPGAEVAYKFLSIVRAPKGTTVLDLGCGSGKASKVLQDAGLSVTAVDFADNAMDPWLRDEIPFLKHDLTKPLQVKAKFGFCSDVMEHVPEEDTRKTLRNILDCCDVAFLQISCVEETWGELIGEELHVTVKPPQWWRDQLEALNAVVIVQQLYDRGVIFLAARNDWRPVGDEFNKIELNVPNEKIIENIRTNLENGWTVLTPYFIQDMEVMLLGGGPSLNDFEDEIREKRAAGMPLITTNGAYHWCLEKGITPSAQVVVDAREFNGRFLKPDVPTCKYFVASQCDPSILEGMPKDRTMIWHSCTDDETLQAIHEIVKAPLFPVPGGSTVMLRAIMLLQVLGYHKIHVYGMDSSVRESHHAYEQKENDGGLVLKVKTRTKEFDCEPWMASQAIEFQKMAGLLDDSVELAVYGDGLIATMIRESAES